MGIYIYQTWAVQESLNVLFSLWKGITGNRHTPPRGPKAEFVVRHLRIEKGTGAKVRRTIVSGTISGTRRSAIGQFFNPEYLAIVNSAQSSSRFQRLVFIEKDQWTIFIILKGINQVHKTFQKNRNRLISMKYSPHPPAQGGEGGYSK